MGSPEMTTSVVRKHEGCRAATARQIAEAFNRPAAGGRVKALSEP
jgi:hypothetical protein